MLFKRTAVRPAPRNILGKRARRRLTLREVLGLEFAGIAREDFLDLLDMGYRLPLMGGTSKQNQTLANAVYFPKATVVTTDQTINQNDMVWWDGVNYTLKILTTAAQVAVGTTGGFCGCAAGSNVPGVYPNPAAGVPSENLPGILVQRGGTVGLTLQSNDVVDYPFQAVTAAGVDAQTVTKGAATSANRVGLVIVPAPVTPRGAPGATPLPESVPGGGRVEVWLESKFPTTILL
jgi:hypothetical protein